MIIRRIGAGCGWSTVIAKDQGLHGGQPAGSRSPYVLRPFFFSDQYDLGCEHRGFADREGLARGAWRRRLGSSPHSGSGRGRGGCNEGNCGTTATPFKSSSTPDAASSTELLQPDSSF